MNYEDIIYAKKEGVARIIINRIDVYNAFRTKTIEEMIEVISDASADKIIGVVVISGAGGKAFCSGGDIKEMSDLTSDTGRVFLQKFFRLLELIRQAPKPVIAAVDGYCLGGGNEINIVCDLTLATERSVFGQVGPTVGSIPLLAGAQFLPKNVGEKRAKEIIFLCQRYKAAEAKDIGWVNKVIPDTEFEKEVDNWCKKILGMSPQSLRLAKLSINFESDQLYPSFMHGIEMLCSVYGSDELKEGMNAFLEKRKPNFNKFRK